MKKILILANNDVGLYNFRKELIEKLLGEGYEVLISLPEGDKVKNLIDLGCRYIETKVSRRGTNPITDLGLFIHYMKMFMCEKPDMVFSYTIKPNIYGGMACALSNIPYVVNITGLGTAVEGEGVLQKITTLLYKIAFCRVQRVFFQNEANREFFVKKKIARGKHKLLPGSGVNLEKFAYMEYPVDTNIQFAFISRIMKEKGINQYIDAAKVIKEKYRDTIFHICGFCEEAYEDILLELHKSGVVNYHGMVSDVREVLKDVHCVVHPTYYPEGLSNVLLEGAACGRPLITTDRSGCREVIDDEINGFIVKQKNSDDLIEKIEKFISLSYEDKCAMGVLSRKKVETTFDRNIVIRAYLEELETKHS